MPISFLPVKTNLNMNTQVYIMEPSTEAERKRLPPLSLPSETTSPGLPSRPPRCFTISGAVSNLSSHKQNSPKPRLRGAFRTWEEVYGQSCFCRAEPISSSSLWCTRNNIPNPSIVKGLSDTTAAHVTSHDLGARGPGQKRHCTTSYAQVQVLSNELMPTSPFSSHCGPSSHGLSPYIQRTWTQRWTDAKIVPNLLPDLWQNIALKWQHATKTGPFVLEPGQDLKRYADSCGYWI